jgi:hypothetical protein
MFEVTEIPNASALSSSTSTYSIPQFAWTKSLAVTFEDPSVGLIRSTELRFFVDPSHNFVAGTGP